MDTGQTGRLVRKTGTVGQKIMALVTNTPANNWDVDGGVEDGKQFRVCLANWKTATFSTHSEANFTWSVPANTRSIQLRTSGDTWWRNNCRAYLKSLAKLQHRPFISKKLCRIHLQYSVSFDPCILCHFSFVCWTSSFRISVGTMYIHTQLIFPILR